MGYLYQNDLNAPQRCRSVLSGVRSVALVECQLHLLLEVPRATLVVVVCGLAGAGAAGFCG